MAGPAPAATYYVDFAGGSDAAAGTQVAPWKHLPGDSAATGNAASTTINGDTLYLKGGVTYDLSSVNGIYIKSPEYNTAGGGAIIGGEVVGFGSGRPIVDGAAAAAHWFRIYNMTNFILRGIEMQNSVGDDGSGALWLYSCTSNQIVDCHIHDSGTNVTSRVDTVELSGDGKGNVVSNCTIWNATEKLVEIHDTSRTNTIANNRMWNACDHGIVLSSHGNRVFGNTVSNVSVNVWITTRTDPGYGIKCAPPADGADGNIIYNNIVSHCSGGFFLDDIYAVPTRGNKLLNNTFVDCGEAVGSPNAIIAINNADGYHTNFLCFNNIFVTEADVADWEIIAMRLYNPVHLTNCVFAYNLFYGTQGSVFAMVNVSGTQESTLANFCDNGSTSPDWRFASANFGGNNSFDAASQVFNDNPDFTNYPELLTLTASSPAKGTGTNLSAYFTTDFNDKKLLFGARMYSTLRG